MKSVILDEFLNIENVYFSEPVKNTVIPNSTFRRIIYSNNYVSLNNIHLKLKLDNIKFLNFTKNSNACLIIITLVLIMIF